MGSLGEVTPLRDGIAKPFGGSSICRRVQIGGDDRDAVFAQSCNGGRPDQAACTGHEFSLGHPASCSSPPARTTAIPACGPVPLLVSCSPARAARKPE